MQGKKLFAGITALAAVCALSVGGTLAYLTATTDAVTNTFVVGGILDEDGSLKVEENAPVRQTDGTYTLNTGSWVTSGSYGAVLPGDTLPKNPTVKIADLLVDAYVFVEIVDDTNYIEYTVNNAWTELSGVTGQNGGKVYAAAKLTPRTSWSQEILGGNTVDVKDNATGNLGTLEFYGYLCQAATFATPAAAWNACFGA